MTPEWRQALYTAFEQHGASPDLLAIIGSIDDTLSADECLDLLRDYNKRGIVLEEVSIQ